MYLAQFLASCASLFWTPAKDASVPNLVPAGPAGRGQPVQPAHHVRYRAGRRGPVHRAVAWSAGRSATVAATSPTGQRPGQPGAVLQRRHLRGIRGHHLLAAGDRQPDRQRADLRALGAEGHLGGMAVHRPHPGGARPGHRDGGRLRGRRRGGRPGPALYQEHAAGRQRPAGVSCSRRSSSGWPRACSSACGSCAGSAGAGCSACPSPRPRCRSC